MAPPTVALSDYLTKLTDLLHDPNYRFWSQAQLTRFINQALQRRDVDTGGNRVLITFPMIVGTDTYTFTTAGEAKVFDVVGVNLLYNNLRLVLRPMSFTDLNAKIRQYNPPLQWAPVAFCRYGPNQIIVAPAPGSTYSLELDLLRYSSPLVATTDVDVLPYPYTECVPYYAAYLAKQNERQYDEAEFFKSQYEEHILEAVAQRTGMASAYPGWV